MNNTHQTNRYHLGENLRFLNNEIKKLVAESKFNNGDETLKSTIKELYDLKTDVLLKLMCVCQVKSAALGLQKVQHFSNTKILIVDRVKLEVRLLHF